MRRIFSQQSAIEHRFPGIERALSTALRRRNTSRGERIDELILLARYLLILCWNDPKARRVHMALDSVRFYCPALTAHWPWFAKRPRIVRRSVQIMLMTLSTKRQGNCYSFHFFCLPPACFWIQWKFWRINIWCINTENKLSACHVSCLNSGVMQTAKFEDTSYRYFSCMQSPSCSNIGRYVMVSLRNIFARSYAGFQTQARINWEAKLLLELVPSR